MGHIKSYIRLIRCFFWPFLRWSICICIELVFVATLCCFLLLYQIPPPFLRWGICIFSKFVFVSTLCCFLLLYKIPPPFLRWGMTWGGALLNNTYWTLNNSLPQPYLTRLCFVYWTSVIHFYTVEPQLCSHSIQSVHLRLNSHCLSNQYWPSTSYWPANSFQITARQALIAGNHSHQYHHLDQAHLMRSQHSQKYSKNWINPNKIKSMPNKQETFTISPRHHPLLVKS